MGEFMTDHRPEVRELLDILDDYLHDIPPDADLHDYPTRMASLASALRAWKAALSATPIEPVGVRAALEQLVAVAQDVCNADDRRDAGLGAYIIRLEEPIKHAQAALASCEPKEKDADRT